MGALYTVLLDGPPAAGPPWCDRLEGTRVLLELAVCAKRPRIISVLEGSESLLEAALAETTETCSVMVVPAATAEEALRVARGMLQASGNAPLRHRGPWE